MNRRRPGCLAVGRRVGTAGPQPVARQVVERRAGPAQRFDHVELVGSGPVVELLVFLFEIIRQLDRQEELEADAGVAEELVVEERPDESPHLPRIALDLLGFIHPVDQDDDALVAQGIENALELAQELISFFGAAARGGRQRLASQLGRLEPEQLPAQGRRIAARAPAAPCEYREQTTRRAPAASPSKASRPASAPGARARCSGPCKAGKQGDQRDDQQARAEADLQVAAGPERAKAGPAAQPAPAPRDRLARARRRRARPGARGRAAGRA